MGGGGGGPAPPPRSAAATQACLSALIGNIFVGERDLVPLCGKSVTATSTEGEVGDAFRGARRRARARGRRVPRVRQLSPRQITGVACAALSAEAQFTALRGLLDFISLAGSRDACVKVINAVVRDADAQATLLSTSHIVGHLGVTGVSLISFLTAEMRTVLVEAAIEANKLGAPRSWYLLDIYYGKDVSAGQILRDLSAHVRALGISWHCTYMRNATFHSPDANYPTCLPVVRLARVRNPCPGDPTPQRNCIVLTKL